MEYLKEVERRLDLPPAEKEQVMNELESHHIELMEELLSAGMSKSAAREEAARRMGDPRELATHMQSVHCLATHRTALLTAFPFFSAALTAMALLLLRSFGESIGYQYSVSHVHTISMLLGLLLIALPVWELLAERRPTWLATWIPGGIVLTAFSMRQIVFVAEAESILRPLSLLPPAWYDSLHDLIGLPRTDPRSTVAGLLAIIGMTALCTLVYRRSLRSDVVFILLGATAAATLCHRLLGLSSTNLGVYVAAAIGVVLLYAIAFGLPRFGRSGLLVYPSLFLFALIALCHPFAPGVFYGLFQEMPYRACWHWPVWLGVGSMLAAGSVYLAVRSSAWPLKLVWMSLGTLAVIVSGQLAINSNGVSVSDMLIGMLWYLTLIILIPAALRKLRRVVEAAHS